MDCTKQWYSWSILQKGSFAANVEMLPEVITSRLHNDGSGPCSECLSGVMLRARKKLISHLKYKEDFLMWISDPGLFSQELMLGICSYSLLYMSNAKQACFCCEGTKPDTWNVLLQMSLYITSIDTYFSFCSRLFLHIL